MNKYNKRALAPLSVRLTPEQRARLKKAAELETQRRGETIDLSELLRQLGMAGVDRILAEAAQSDGPSLVAGDRRLRREVPAS
jgi:hypothetical protein